MNRKWGYNEHECNLLEKYLTFSEQMATSLVTIKDDNDEDAEKGEMHMVMVLSDEVDSLDEADIKMIELELNLYALNDAIKEVEKRKKRVEEKAEEAVKDEMKGEAISLIVTLYYLSELKLQLIKSITNIEEEVQSLFTLTTESLQKLINQTRLDL